MLVAATESARRYSNLLPLRWFLVDWGWTSNIERPFVSIEIPMLLLMQLRRRSVDENLTTPFFREVSRSFKIKSPCERVLLGSRHQATSCGRSSFVVRIKLLVVNIITICRDINRVHLLFFIILKQWQLSLCAITRRTTISSTVAATLTPIAHAHPFKLLEHLLVHRTNFLLLHFFFVLLYCLGHPKGC